MSETLDLDLATVGQTLIEQQKTPCIIITYDNYSHSILLEQLNYFIAEPGDIYTLPEWEILPYDHFSPHKDIVSARLAALANLRQSKKKFCVVPCHAAMQKVPPARYLDAHTFTVKLGDSIFLDSIRQELSEKSYNCVSTVTQHGEFAIRGAILDIFPMGHHTPYRIEFFDQDVDTIRVFDPESQCSIKHVNSIACLPGHEFALDDDSVAIFRQAWRTFQPDGWQINQLYQYVSDKKSFPGIEQYLPLFFDGPLPSLFELLPENTLIYHLAPQAQALDTFMQLVDKRYEQAKFQRLLPPLNKTALYLNTQDWQDKLAPFKQINLHLTQRDTPRYDIEPKSEAPMTNLKKHITQSGRHCHLVINTPSRAQFISDQLSKANIPWQFCNQWQALNAKPGTVSLASGPLSLGFITSAGIEIITEEMLFPTIIKQTQKGRDIGRQSSQRINHSKGDFFDPGCTVVHEDHGIGRYIGLELLAVDGIEQEFLTISYADKDKLYVPVNQMHLLSRYAGADPNAAPLDKLGSNLWEKRKSKAHKQIEDIAANLLAIYAKRAAAKGQAKTIDKSAYQAFIQACTFSLTPDQQSAVDETLADLQKPQPMDRLICGDVGFGKTEVAMHAAFVTSYGQNQVILLVPTTLLAEQHTQTFIERFAQWPITIGCLSRLKKVKTRENLVEDFNAGKVDILIGTHQVLTAGLNTDKLGLLIIDEEHRFGVKQKETLKKLRVNVDLLSLTATPIPRTLHMSLSGLRELSLIATAPEKRLSIETSVHSYQKDIVVEAIERELLRGGQVYFLHNKVQTIERMARILQDWLPQRRIAIAHGQLPKSKLEMVMRDFYQHRIDILVCTTIIESGIDIPNANTMIINQAHRFGLAQLHQCRGRVGRSHHQAYAYLLTPEDVILPADAIRRLQAIQSLDYLGAGFNLASQDLEIRGTGELLGEQQSGQVEGMGLSLYITMLNRAIERLKNDSSNGAAESQCKLDVRCQALIPAQYIPEPDLRLALYQQLQRLPDEKSITGFKFEMQDRFGKIPEALDNLLQNRKWQFWGDSMGWLSMKSGRKTLVIDLGTKPNMNIQALIKLIQTQPQQFQLKQQTKLHCKLNSDNLTEAITDVLQELISICRINQTSTN